MGLGVRVLFREEDGTFTRVSVRQFDRFWNHDPDVAFPRFAGRAVYYAHVLVELENRRPVGIATMEFNVLHVDSKGRLDRSKLEERMQLAADLYRVPSAANSNLVDIRPILAQKKMEQSFQWKPTRKQLAEIMAIATDLPYGC